jgi:hypothetical protein
MSEKKQTVAFDRYRFSPDEIARYRCLDCGRNVVEIGDFLMLRPEIWNDELHLGWDDNLCLACIERRLGRKLRGLLDIVSLPTVEGYPRSATLMERLPRPSGVRKGGSTDV